MGIARTLEAARGWLELGLPEDALHELASIRGDRKAGRDVLEVKLAAQMGNRQWNLAADTAKLLCIKASHEPSFFLRAAFCLHETGDTFAACNWLMRGPKSLHEMAIFHFNMACYLWTLGHAKRAESHLTRALAMDRGLADGSQAADSCMGDMLNGHRVD